MKALLMMSLAPLLLASDALFNNNVFNTHPYNPVLYAMPSARVHEPVFRVRQRFTRDQMASHRIPQPQPLGHPDSYESSAETIYTLNTHNNHHNNHNQQGSHILAPIPSTQRSVVIGGSGFLNTMLHHRQRTPTVLNPKMSTINAPPSQDHRTTTFVSQVPRAPTQGQDQVHKTTTLKPSTVRPPGSIRGSHSPTTRKPIPTTLKPVPMPTQPTRKPSTTLTHHNPVTQQASKPEIIGQSKPSLQDPNASLRNPICYNAPDHGTCRAALPRYHFDPETGTCNCFLFGGCREHGEGEGPGTFLTLGECQRECVPPKQEEGPICKEIFKEEHFESFLQPHSTPPQKTHVDLSHISDKEFLESFTR